MSLPVTACPRCGTPARVVVLVRARIRCELDADGEVGRVLSASREDSSPVAYECGGGHSWRASALPLCVAEVAHDECCPVCGVHQVHHARAASGLPANRAPDTFVVICKDEGGYVLTTRRVWADRAEAQRYAETCAPSREALVVPGDFRNLRFDELEMKEERHG